MTTRYMTPIKYKDGNGAERRTKLHFELDPVEFMDWTFEHPFEANELQASLIELKDIESEESRDLSQDEVRTMLSVIKLLCELSAGRPTDDGDYFIKDPNWTSSYAYRGFRLFLLTNPNEVQQFLEALMDNDVMSNFTTALEEANTKVMNEKSNKKSTGDSGSDTVEKMRAKLAEMEAAQTPSDD
jgi:hypothetical protein